MTNEMLVKIADEAKEMAYSPFSNFKVGAALLGKSGKVYTGCNVENSSYGGTNCAERTAIFKAISEGEREFDKIAIMSSSGDITSPCGICRQVIFEFMSEGEVILGKKSGEIEVYTVRELLPLGFKL